MSKAFVKEDGEGGLGADGDDEPEPTLPAGGKRYITPAGFVRLAEERDRLWKIDRRKVCAEVSAAAELGDRSENAEYLYGKRKLRQIDARLRFLDKLTDRLTVVQDVATQDGRVRFSAWITIRDENDTLKTWRLVGPDETNLKAGHISVDSPLARSVLGKKKGDIVEVRRPHDVAEVEIVDVRYGPAPKPATAKRKRR